MLPVLPAGVLRGRLLRRTVLRHRLLRRVLPDRLLRSAGEGARGTAARRGAEELLQHRLLPLNGRSLPA